MFSEKTQGGPAVPRPAATAILVRDGEAGLEVYLLKRSAKSGFMPGHYVFPGGTVDVAGWKLIEVSVSRAPGTSTTSTRFSVV